MTLEYYLELWRLTLLQSIENSSDISSVYVVKTTKNDTAVLKIPKGKGIEGERLGATALKYFGTDGAVKCLKSDKHVQLLDYIDGDMVRVLVDRGKDNQATQIIAGVVKKLHNPRNRKKPQLVSLRDHLKDLYLCSEKNDTDSHYKWAVHLANNLLNTVKFETVLHGDIHHENIMHSSKYGWIAIDPKGLYGDPHYDLANCFNNPIGHEDLIQNPERINIMATIFSDELGYDKKRLIQFACIHMAASSAWHLSNDYNIQGNISLHNSKILREILES
jgi:streptomycin 6-kinase